MDGQGKGSLGSCRHIPGLEQTSNRGARFRKGRPAVPSDCSGEGDIHERPMIRPGGQVIIAALHHFVSRKRCYFFQGAEFRSPFPVDSLEGSILLDQPFAHCSECERAKAEVPCLNMDWSISIVWALAQPVIRITSQKSFRIAASTTSDS